MNGMTVQDLINKLNKVNNKAACVVLCELDREYICFARVIDETTKRRAKDGSIGVVCLTLDSDEKERRETERK
jgi:hypothetical protein